MVCFNFSHINSKDAVRALSALFFFGFISQSAQADSGDVFNTVIGTSYTHDSNLFRLPSGRQPTGVGAERSDNILRTNVGFKINKSYSLQTFNFDFTHAQSKYDNAKYLDFEANNYSGAWLWAVTPSLRGVLSADRKVDLVPFSDLTNAAGQNTSIQNIRTVENQIFSFDWSPHNKWHLLGSYNKLDSINSQTFLPETSFKLDAIEGGVKYVFPSESFVSFSVRDSQGENQVTNFAQQVGKTFDEKQEELKLFWILSGKSRLSSNFGHLRRVDDDFSIRDFSDYFGGVNYTWDVTGKTSLQFSLSRRVAAFLDTTSSYTTYDSIGINPTWYATPKIAVRANAQLTRRKFLGDAPVFSAVEREDDGFVYGIGLDWTPRSTIKIGFNLTRDTRDSNSVRVNGVDRDYTTNAASVTGQLTF